MKYPHPLIPSDEKGRIDRVFSPHRLFEEPDDVENEASLREAFGMLFALVVQSVPDNNHRVEALNRLEDAFHRAISGLYDSQPTLYSVVESVSQP